MTDEKPTTEEGGASIAERLEAKWTAEDAAKGSQQEASPETPDVEAKQSESDGEEQEAGPQLSISDVAKILGVDETALDVDEDGTVKVKTKVDGKEGAAKFAELLKSYQLQSHVDARAREVAESHRQAQERVQQFESYAQQKAMEFEQIFNAGRQAIMGEFGNVDWDSLSKNDWPTYIEKRHAYEAKVAQLQQIKDAADQEAQNFHQAQQYRQAQRLAAEQERLTTLVPEWKDEAVRVQELGKLVPWLQQKGVSRESLAALDNSLLADAGLIAALRAGMVAEGKAPKAMELEKKVRAAPKLVKPGQPIDANQRGAETIKELRDKVRRTGGKGGSFADLLLARGQV